MVLQVMARSASLTRLGEVTDYASLELVLRYNGVSTFLLTMDGRGPGAALMAGADGIVVSRDGVVILSGSVETEQRVLDNGASRYVVAGKDDTGWLQFALAMPVPSGPPYTANAYDVRSGKAETVIRQYVDLNLGPGAITARRLTGLTLAADLARGATVYGQARFQTVLELAQELGQAGGLGFRIVQVGLGLQFQAYVPADRTRTAVFSLGLGNLQGYDYSRSDPTATYAYVAGQGEGTARTIVEGGVATTLPRRRETFRDQRDTNDSLALTQSRDDALTEGGTTNALSLVPIDTASVAFGRDYGLGDRVTVLVDGIQVQDVVREVKLAYAGSGAEQISPTVGTPGVSSPDVPALFDTLVDQSQRLSRLERR